MASACTRSMAFKITSAGSDLWITPRAPARTACSRRQGREGRSDEYRRLARQLRHKVKPAFAAKVEIEQNDVRPVLFHGR